MKRGQKNSKTGIFSDFFMARKEIKNYSMERTHLTKKKRLSHVKAYGRVFFSQMGPLFRVTFDPFPGHEKIRKNSSLHIFLPSFYLNNKILT
jgi:hypothetical protein